MHVESVAILDTLYAPESYGSTISTSGPEAAANLSQIAAVGSICNSAAFETSTSSENEKPAAETIVGNATGASFITMVHEQGADAI